MLLKDLSLPQKGFLVHCVLFTHTVQSLEAKLSTALPPKELSFDFIDLGPFKALNPGLTL